MIIIGNGTLVTNVPGQPVVKGGAVAVDAGRIVAVGDTAALRNGNPGHEFVDAEGGIIMPGLVNLHHHFYSALARGMMTADPKVSRNFMEILENLWFRLDKALTPRDIRLSADLSLAESIKSGVTSVIDHHASFGAIEGSLDEIAAASRQAGVRVATCFEVSDRCGPDTARAAIDENVRFIRKVAGFGDGMNAGLFGLHASFTLSDATLAACKKAAGEGGFHVHVAEGRADVEDCLKNHGKRVVERLSDFGILGENSLAVHCIHISPEEMDMLAEAGTTVVHNPQSNMGNAVGCSPLLEMMRRGVRTALGTDGYTHDVFESAKAAVLLQRHHLSDPSVGWNEPYEMLLENNPNVAGRIFNRRLGVLEQDAAADVIVVDYNPPTNLVTENLVAHIHFGMYGPLVRTSMIDGKLVMRDRRILTMDEEAMRAACRENALALWRKL